MNVSAAGSVWNNALTAYNNGSNKINDAATRIASGSVASSDDFGASEVVDLKQGELEASAGAKVMDIYDKTIGSIIDIEC